MANSAGHYLIYNRKSTDDAENQKNSLAYQRLRNLEYAKSNNLPIASLSMKGFCEHGIVDESHSGFKEDADFEIDDSGLIQHRVSRPKFLQLVRILKNREFKGALFLSWDRASRNRQDSVLLQKLIKLGCDIRFVEATYDKSSAGELHQDIDGMFAAHYSRVIGEKVKNAYRKLQAEGRCTYLAPIGYLDKGSDNKPFDPERAPIVKRIFELYATGEWSIVQLAKWAREQGLTQKSSRRKRTREEIASNLDIATVPKICHPVTHKTIEFILKNPFFIGKIRMGNGQHRDSKAHQPLIDTALFYKVQKTLASKRVSVHYPEQAFFTYRGLARCTCGRLYSPYEQKGGVYYRSKCQQSCDNADNNLTEAELTEAVKGLLKKIYFTDDELAQIEAAAKKELGGITAERNKKLEDLHVRQRNVVADLDYLTQHRVSLMRTGAMTPEAISADENRLHGLLSGLNEEIKAYAESAQDMLKYVISFSELVKNASLYFDQALDNEKRDLVTQVFHELTIKQKTVASYRAKDGFDALLARFRVSGSPLTLFLELLNMYPRVRRSMEAISVSERTGLEE